MIAQSQKKMNEAQLLLFIDQKRECSWELRCWLQMEFLILNVLKPWLFVREALLLRQDLNLRAAVVASDCANVVRSIKEGSRGMSSMITEEIRRMTTTAGDVSFRYERRRANFDAHHIARSLLNWCQAAIYGFGTP